MLSCSHTARNSLGVGGVYDLDLRGLGQNALTYSRVFRFQYGDELTSGGARQLPECCLALHRETQAYLSRIRR